MKILTVRPKGDRNIFINFIEEFRPGQREGYIMGRLEIDNDKKEDRFFTNKEEEFNKFRERWDFRYVTKERLEKIRKIIKEKFMEVKYD